MSTQALRENNKVGKNIDENVKRINQGIIIIHLHSLYFVLCWGVRMRLKNIFYS